MNDQKICPCCKIVPLVWSQKICIKCWEHTPKKKVEKVVVVEKPKKKYDTILHKPSARARWIRNPENVEKYAKIKQQEEERLLKTRKQLSRILGLV